MEKSMKNMRSLKPYNSSIESTKILTHKNTKKNTLHPRQTRKKERRRTNCARLNFSNFPNLSYFHTENSYQIINKSKDFPGASQSTGFTKK
jgi:hypothetical protein